MAQIASLNSRGSESTARPKVTPIDGKTEPRSTPLAVADQRLLGFLVKAGKMDRGEAEAAKTACEAQGLSLIEFVVTANRLSDHDVADALAQGLGLPRLRLEAVQVDEWVAGLVDQATATRAGLVAISADAETVTLAMANPFDQDAIKYVEFASGRRVRRAVASRSEIIETIAQAYAHEGTLAAVLADVPESETVELISGTTPSSNAHEVDADKLAQEAEQAPIVKMVNLILVNAVTSKASDIHIEPGPNLVLVRYRIDGILIDGHQLPKWVQNPLTARIKIMARADITERRTPQDGHFTIRQGGRIVDIRVSVLPTTDGEKFVLRLLDPNSVPRRLDQIGMAGRDLEVVRELIRKPEGIILVTGPTGSGKSSTLCAMIQEIFTPERNIVTIENPVEFNLKGVTQVEINEKQDLTFAAVLRSVLRQDPDVIMVGEIRDHETAEIAFRAAQTGHLVISTLHTNDTVSTITRLVDIGVEPYLIASSLIAVVSQRLVRKVCEHCAEPTPEVPELAGRQQGQRRGKGCSACHQTGFSGRTACYETLVVTKGIQRLIESKASESQVRLLAEEEGMVSLRENALAKVQAGITTRDEAMRVIQFDTRDPQCPQCMSAVEEYFMTCPYCRHVLRHACAACGKTLKKKWTSCPYCGAGAPTDAKAAPPPANEPPASYGRLTAIESAGGVRQKPRILIVDDYADLRTLVRAALQAGGDVVIDEAESGADALAAVEKERPHLVILDLMMPGMDGFEVCRQMRSNLKTAFIPILMLTAMADTKSKSLGFLAGIDDYLVKPFDNAELRSRVSWLLQRSYQIGVGEPPGAARA